MSSLDNGVGINFGVGLAEARPKLRRAESGDGVLGEGTASPPAPPTRGFAGAL